MLLLQEELEKEKKNQAEKVVTHAFSFMMIYSVIVASLLYFVVPFVFILIGLKGELLQKSTIYMQTLLLGFPGSMITFQSNASVRSTGNTIFPMLVLFFSALINACCDPILIFGLFGFPKFGMQGAALSTSIAKWFSAILCIYILFTGKLNLKIQKPTLKIDWRIIKNIVQIGIPSSLQTLTVSVSRVILISFSNFFGTESAAAFTIGQKIDALAFMPVFAFAIAIETMVGQNIGAKKFERVKQFIKSAIFQLSCIMLIVGIIYLLFAKNIAGIFTNNNYVINLVKNYLHITVLGYFFFIIGQSCSRSLSGAGHSLRSMFIVASMLFFIQIPISYFLSKHTSLNVEGVFWGITIGHFVYASISIFAIRGNSWMLKKV